MIVDVLLILAGVFAIVTGYRRGFLQTVFATVGYIGGGLAGLALALHSETLMHNAAFKFGLTLLAILVGAEIGQRILGSLAKIFHARILWTPLRFIDSLAGVVLECLRVGVLAYLLISLVLWSPWSAARNAVSESTIYPKVNKAMPHIVTQLRSEIEKNFSVNLPK